MITEEESLKIRDNKGQFIKGKMFGKNNLFYGKKHSSKSKKKIGKKSKGRNIGIKSNLYKDGRCQNKNYLSWIKNKRNRLLNSGAVGSHTFGEWETLKTQYNHTCPACGLREPFENQRCKTLTEDHIIPLEKGGSDNIENIQPLCLRCNQKKHTKIIFYE